MNIVTFTLMLGRVRPKEEAKPKKTFESVAIQVDAPGSGQGTDLPGSEEDEIVPWDAPSLERPICSWSSFPLAPSTNLKMLVDFFAKTPEDDPATE